MIALNDSFWLISSAYVLLNVTFRQHPCYIEMIELFHLVCVPAYVLCHVCVCLCVCVCVSVCLYVIYGIFMHMHIYYLQVSVYVVCMCEVTYVYVLIMCMCVTLYVEIWHNCKA